VILTEPAHHSVSIQYPDRPVDHDMCLQINLPTTYQAVPELSTLMLHQLNFYQNDQNCQHCPALADKITQRQSGYLKSL
jgi:hypothetical protein